MWLVLFLGSLHGEAIIREGTASYSSLEQEIDRFQFEEETILVSEAEEGVDEHSACKPLPRW